MTLKSFASFSFLPSFFFGERIFLLFLFLFYQHRVRSSFRKFNCTSTAALLLSLWNAFSRSKRTEKKLNLCVITSEKLFTTLPRTAFFFWRVNTKKSTTWDTSETTESLRRTDPKVLSASQFHFKWDDGFFFRCRRRCWSSGATAAPPRVSESTRRIIIIVVFSGSLLLLISENL